MQAQTESGPLQAAQAGLAEGTVGSLESLYRRHRDPVYRLALRYARDDPGWAQDVAQDVFLVALRKLHRRP